MKNPLVSIVIPIYNVSDYVEECIKSVINQTYSNLEIICIDDCGTDNSMEIVKQFHKDPRVNILINSKNIGLGASRNKGAQFAHGDYLFFLDSDDYLYPDSIKRLVESASSSGADITVGSVEAFLHDSDSSVCLHERINEYIVKLNRQLAIKPFEITVSNESFLYALKFPCIAWGKLYKTTFLRDNQITFVENKVRHEDNGYHIKCMSCLPKVVGISSCNYRYRIRTNSIMWDARNDESIRIKHLKLSLDDALQFLSDRRKYKYLEGVKDAYWYLYAKRTKFLTYYIGKYEKHIKLFGVNLLKQSSNGKIIKTHILGIRIRSVYLH